MKEHYYEKLLNIKTTGEQKEFNESQHYNRYEPTSYKILEELFKEYTLENDDCILDLGCGKGRLIFYINYHFNVSAIGIEMNKFYLEEAEKNKKNYYKKCKNSNISFYNSFAEKYEIEDNINKFYFFNPFSLQIFSKVIQNIFKSLEKSPRNIDIIMYYPSQDYIYYIENSTAFILLKEIRIPDLYENNENERILIYRFNAW